MRVVQLSIPSFHGLHKDAWHNDLPFVYKIRRKTRCRLRVTLLTQGRLTRGQGLCHRMVLFDLLGLDAVSGQIAAGENARVPTSGTEGFCSNAAECFGVGHRSTCL